MATRVGRDQHEKVGGVTLAERRTEVIEILAGGLIALLLRRGADPGPGGPRTPENSVISGQILASE